MELALTITEHTQLAECEAVIERGLHTFMEVGDALLKIRQNRLYRNTHESFEDYCRERWGFRRSHADNLIDAARVVADLNSMEFKPPILPLTERQARPLTLLDTPEDRQAAWQRAVETAPDGKVTGKHVQAVVDEMRGALAETSDEPWQEPPEEWKAARPHVANNSGENEWYTPSKYIDAARAAMGSIDLDPASCEAANKTVKATTFYTDVDDGLVQPWYKNVWMNPPYAQPLVQHFSQRLIEHVNSGEVEQACVLVNNATDTAWFQSMLEICDAACFIKGRVRFIDKAGNPTGAPLQGQVVLYFGVNRDAFRDAFSVFGTVVHVG